MNDPEKVFLQNLDRINRIVAHVCRRNHLQPQDAEDFRSHAYEKLIENGYGILQAFEERSSLPTFLTTVIGRLYSQYRIKQWGKWRPSAEAQRMGDKAITVERLMTRDGFTLEETIQTLTTGADPLYTRAEIEGFYQRLPVRQQRMVMLSQAVVPDMPDKGAAPDDGLWEEEREAKAKVALGELEKALATLEEEDRTILRMRFDQQATVPQIAAALGLEQKKLYKRIDKLLRDLRSALQRAGIDPDDVLV